MSAPKEHLVRLESGIEAARMAMLRLHHELEALDACHAPAEAWGCIWRGKARLREVVSELTEAQAAVGLAARESER